MTGAEDRQCGSATILVLGLASVLTTLAVLLTALGSVAVARHRAAVAADLAALAAASRSSEGEPAACAYAGQVAAAQGAELAGCRFVGGADGLGDTVDVQVLVRPDGRVGALGTVRTRARAGPAQGAAAAR